VVKPNEFGGHRQIEMVVKPNKKEVKPIKIGRQAK
jgi:hypothetical protein